MNLLMGLFVGLLFVALTPGILVRIPKRGKPLTVALVHGVVFGVIFYFAVKMLYNAGYTEGFNSDLPLSPEAEKVHARIAVDKSLLTPERNEKLNILKDFSRINGGQTALNALNKDSTAIAKMNSMLTSKDDDGTKFDKVLDFLIAYVNKLVNTGECKAYAKEWETTERAKLKLVVKLVANATNEINVLTKEVDDLRRNPRPTCIKLMALSKGNLTYNGCVNSIIRNQIMTKMYRIRELQDKVKNDTAKINDFQIKFEPACRGKTGCEDLIGKKVKAEAEADWYCTVKMDKECSEVMNALRDIVSQLAVYKC